MELRSSRRSPALRAERHEIDRPIDPVDWSRSLDRSSDRWVDRPIDPCLSASPQFTAEAGPRRNRVLVTAPSRRCECGVRQNIL
eukprot:5645214-Pyramimonas_sp.AAC.1